MRANVYFICQLLLSFLLFGCAMSANAVNVINNRRQVNVLQQQQQQLQSTLHIRSMLEQHSQKMQVASKQSIYQPMVRFLTTTATQQQPRVIGHSLPASGLARLANQQRDLFAPQQQQRRTVALAEVNQYTQYGTVIPQQQQQQFVPKFNQQQNLHRQLQKPPPLPTLSSTRLATNKQFVQQQSQPQQVYNYTHFVRLNKKSQQPLQSLLQQLYFPRPQHYAQQSNAYQIQPQPHTQQRQQHNPTSAYINAGFEFGKVNSTDAIINPLLHSYSDEDDLSTSFDLSQLCQTCCVDGQNPCQRCCDIRPFLSASVLKSSAG